MSSDMLIERVITDIRFTHSTHTRMFDWARHNLHALRDVVNLVCGSEYSVENSEAVMVEEDEATITFERRQHDPTRRFRQHTDSIGSSLRVKR
jgi:hypothetical protein